MTNTNRALKGSCLGAASGCVAHGVLLVVGGVLGLAGIVVWSQGEFILLLFALPVVVARRPELLLVPPLAAVAMAVAGAVVGALVGAWAGGRRSSARRGRPWLLAIAASLALHLLPIALLAGWAFVKFLLGVRAAGLRDAAVFWLIAAAYPAVGGLGTGLLVAWLSPAPRGPAPTSG